VNFDFVNHCADSDRSVVCINQRKDKIEFLNLMRICLNLDLLCSDQCNLFVIFILPLNSNFKDFQMEIILDYNLKILLVLISTNVN